MECGTYLVQYRFDRATRNGEAYTSSDIESELPQAKRVRFEEGTPRRSEGCARRKLQLQEVSGSPQHFYAPGEGFSHETRYQAEHDRAEVCKSETGREPASGQDAPEGLHANKTAPRKLMMYPIYTYVTNFVFIWH